MQPAVARLTDGAIEIRSADMVFHCPSEVRWGQRSLFTATSNASESVWLVHRDRAIRDLQVICFYLHQKVMLISGLADRSAHGKLSIRETQCRSLLARGRLPKQIAGDLQNLGTLCSRLSDVSSCKTRGHHNESGRGGLYLS